MGNLLKPDQEIALMNPDMEGATKRKTIPIHKGVATYGTNIYQTFYINDLIQKCGDQDAIYAFPCVCRYGNRLIDSAGNFDFPEESCIAFNMGAVSLKDNASYVTRIKGDAHCKECGNCETYGPTTAMKLINGRVFYRLAKGFV